MKKSLTKMLLAAAITAAGTIGTAGTASAAVTTYNGVCQLDGVKVIVHATGFNDQLSVSTFLAFADEDTEVVVRINGQSFFVGRGTFVNGDRRGKLIRGTASKKDILGIRVVGRGSASGKCFLRVKGKPA